VVEVSAPIRHATPDQPVGVPPPRVFGLTRIAGGCVAAGAGIICLAYDAYGWAAFFVAIGGANLAGGYWYLRIDSSASAQT
jgi:hypothetical protein